MRVERLFILMLLAIMLSGCSGSLFERTKAHKNSQTAPYKITNSQMRNRWFYPQKHYEYSEIGYASHYGGGDNTHGRLTASGEMFDNNRLTAAHRTLPIPTIVRVTNLENGRSVILKVNDRGPFHETHKRIIDVSDRAAKLLGFHKHGLTRVRVTVLVDESIRVATNHGSYRDNLKRSHHKRQRLVLANYKKKRRYLPSGRKTNKRPYRVIQKKKKQSRYAVLPPRQSYAVKLTSRASSPSSIQMAYSSAASIIPKMSPFRKYY